MFFSSIKKINRLLSKGMSNVYLKVVINKNWLSQDLDFLILRNFSSGRFRGSPTHISLKFKTSWCNLKKEVWEWKHVWLFYYNSFEWSYNVLMAQSPCFLLNKNINFKKSEMKSRIENSTHSFSSILCNVCFALRKCF